MPDRDFSWLDLCRVFWRIFRRYMCRFTPSLVAFFCFAAAAVAFSVLSPRILGLATTSIFTDVMAEAEGTGSGIDFAYLARIALSLLALYAGAAACQYMQGRLMTRITNRSTYFIRADISKKLNHLPLSYLENHGHAEILSFVTNDADVIAFSLNQVMTQLINTGLTLIGVAAVMLSMDWMLALVVISVLPVSLLASHLVNKASQRRYHELQAALSDMTAHVGDAYLLHDILRSTQGSEAQLAAFDRLNESMYQSSWRAQFASGTLQPAVSTVSTFAYIGVCVLGSLFAATGRLSIGEVQAFIQYVRAFTQPLTQLASISASVQYILASASRIFAFLDADDGSAVRGQEDAAGIRGDVTFQSVCVRDEDGSPLLRDVSFSVPAGSLVAVAGRHGSGKSLLLKTLAGLYPAAAGKITVDGRDLASFSPGARRELFAAAFQVPWLETDTMAANVSYARPETLPQQVQQAAASVQADAFIREHPDGYDQLLEERHRNLSHGEAELLQLARAVLRDARIPILDDALQSVDPLTKQKALESLARSGKKTVFVATGSADDLRRADYIIFLDRGHIAAAGTLAEVTGTDIFRDFWGESFGDTSV